MTVMLGLLVILLLIVVAIVLSVLQEFWSREVLLADRGIGDAFELRLRAPYAAACATSAACGW